MLDGHIEQLGDPETVYEHPSSAFVAGFIGRNNFWQGTATDNGAVADDGTVFVATRPEEDVPTGQDALAAVRPEVFISRSNSLNRADNAVRRSGVGHLAFW